MDKKPTKTERQLKVYYRYGNIPHLENSILPEIKLKGVWLKEWGFDIGTEIIVSKTQYGLTIIKKNEYPPVIKL